MRGLVTLVGAALLLGACAHTVAPPVKTGKHPDWRALPLYGSVELAAGFMPDPVTVELEAGGHDAVSPYLGPECIGYINAAAPDFDLYYEAGEYRLFFHVTSDADTTLVVYDPDGRWLCSDDAIGLDPVVALGEPWSGNYNVWVGLHDGPGFAPATLHISEIDPLAPDEQRLATPNWRAQPTYATADLHAAFLPDPWTHPVEAGGGDPVDDTLADGCSGYIHAAAPDIDLNYDAGEYPLFVHVRASTDTTLVVRGPDGTWHCDDDTIGHNPMVAFMQPLSGNYNIWVGVHGAPESAPAEVLITEIDPLGVEARRGDSAGQVAVLQPDIMRGRIPQHLKLVGTERADLAGGAATVQVP